jgi:hypothetical protein
MKAQTKTTLLCLTLICGAIYFTSCNKGSSTPPASIVGAWSAAGMEVKGEVGSSVKQDTTYSATLGPAAFIFTAGGYYTVVTGSGNGGGVYSFSGSSLSILDTSQAHGVWNTLGATVSSHSLKLYDTVTHAHDTIELYIFNYTR